MRFVDRLKFANVTAALALVVAVGGTATSAAQILLTGQNVQDESLTGADVQNHTLTGADIRAGSLGSRLFSDRAIANLRGATGATGSMGPKGESGAAGAQGAPGEGVTTFTATGPDVANYQDQATLATTTLNKPGDYVMFVSATARNTGLADDNFNCGLFIDGSEFGGGGTSAAAGDTGDFTTVGATHLTAGDSKTITLKCQGNGVTTFDVSNIEMRVHDLG